jgi:hypothetical protein
MERIEILTIHNLSETVDIEKYPDGSIRITIISQFSEENTTLDPSDVSELKDFLKETK